MKCETQHKNTDGKREQPPSSDARMQHVSLVQPFFCLLEQQRSAPDGRHAARLQRELAENWACELIGIPPATNGARARNLMLVHEFCGGDTLAGGW